AETALDAGTPIIHPELGDNLTFERVHVAGDPDKGFKDADAVVETTFVFGRHTGVTNEPRAPPPSARGPGAGPPDRGLRDPGGVGEGRFVWGRHTGVTNEPRAIL